MRVLLLVLADLLITHPDILVRASDPRIWPLGLRNLKVVALSHLVVLHALALRKRAIPSLFDLRVVRFCADQRKVVVASCVLGAELLRLALVVHDLVVVIVSLGVDLVVFEARLAEILTLSNHFRTHCRDHWPVLVFEIFIQVLLARRYNSLLGVLRADVVVLVALHASNAVVLGRAVVDWLGGLVLHFGSLSCVV